MAKCDPGGQSLFSRALGNDIAAPTFMSNTSSYQRIPKPLHHTENPRVTTTGPVPFEITDRNYQGTDQTQAQELVWSKRDLEYFNALEETKDRVMSDWMTLLYEFKHPLKKIQIGNGKKYRYRLSINSHLSTDWLAPRDPEIDGDRERGIREEQEYIGTTFVLDNDDVDDELYSRTDQADFILWREGNDDKCRVGDFVGEQLGYVEYTNISAPQTEEGWQSTNIPVALKASLHAQAKNIHHKSDFYPHKYVSEGKAGLCLINPNAFKLLGKREPQPKSDVPAPADVLADLNLNNKVWGGAPFLGATAQSGPPLPQENAKYSVWPLIATHQGVWRSMEIDYSSLE